MRTLWLRRLARDERGTTAIEYSLLAALIGIGVIVALQSMGGYINSALNSVSSSL